MVDATLKKITEKIILSVSTPWNHLINFFNVFEVVLSLLKLSRISLIFCIVKVQESIRFQV